MPFFRASLISAIGTLIPIQTVQTVGPTIHGLMCRTSSTFSSTALILSLSGVLAEPSMLGARARNRSPLGRQPAPKLNVRIYGFPGISPWVLQGAEFEATRLLGAAPIRLTWTDCTQRVVAATCISPQLSTDLIGRFFR
jgi:hypothetical protein